MLLQYRTRIVRAKIIIGTLYSDFCGSNNFWLLPNQTIELVSLEQKLLFRNFVFGLLSFEQISGSPKIRSFVITSNADLKVLFLSSFLHRFKFSTKIAVGPVL